MSLKDSRLLMISMLMLNSESESELSRIGNMTSLVVQSMPVPSYLIGVISTDARTKRAMCQRSSKSCVRRWLLVSSSGDRTSN